MSKFLFDDVFCKKGGRAREKITVGTCIAGDTFAPFCQRFYLRTCVVASIFFGAAGLEASFRIHTAIHVTLQNKTSISHVVPIISYHSAESDTTTRAASDDQGHQRRSQKHDITAASVTSYRCAIIKV